MENINNKNMCERQKRNIAHKKMKIKTNANQVNLYNKTDR